MKNRNYAITIIGITLVVFTAILFSLFGDGTRFMLTYFGFVIGAEIVLFGGLLLIESLSRFTSQVILRTVCGLTFGIGSLASIIVSCIYIGRDIDSLRGFYLWQLIIWVIAIIVLTIGYFTASSVNDSDSKTMNAVMTVTLVVNQLTSLSEDNRNAKYAEQLKKIAEELRYSDTSSIVFSDELIQNTVARLELKLMQGSNTEETDREIKTLLNEIHVLINRRKQEVGLIKVGRI
jgi:hypothetical protein